MRADRLRVAAWCAMGVGVGAFWTVLIFVILWWRGAFGG